MGSAGVFARLLAPQASMDIASSIWTADGDGRRAGGRAGDGRMHGGEMGCFHMHGGEKGRFHTHTRSVARTHTHTERRIGRHTSGGARETNARACARDRNARGPELARAFASPPARAWLRVAVTRLLISFIRPAAAAAPAVSLLRRGPAGGQGGHVVVALEWVSGKGGRAAAGGQGERAM